MVLFGIAFIATFVILLARAEMTAGVRRKQMKQDMAKGIYRLDAILHVSGLSAPEKCKCGVVLTPEKLMITCAGKEYTLPLKRITYVDKILCFAGIDFAANQLKSLCLWRQQKYGGNTMEIRVLRYFLTVVREESITKASEFLHITQPTLSRQLAQLEEEVGVKLFDRGTRKIKLTNEGILLRRRAEEILQLVDKTEKELVEQEELVEGKISIGCGEIASVQLLPELFRNFHQKYPRVTFDIFTATADFVKEQMDKGLLDLGLLLEPVDMEKYDFIRMNMKEKWIVLMPPNDLLTEKEFITASDLAELPLILPRRMQVQSELASWFGDYYNKLNVLFTSNLSTNGAVMVSRGLAYSLVIEGSVPFWDASKVAYRPLYPELWSTSVLAWKRGQPFSLAATKFMEFSKCF